MAVAEVREKDDDMFLVDDEEDSQANKFLLFNIGSETYGIDIKVVTGIEEMLRITHVPNMPEYIKGVINLRGKVLPVMDIRLRFGMEERAYDDRTCIIVVSIHDRPIGFIVDTVAEVHDIPRGNIEEPPHFKNDRGDERYISGLGKIGDEVKILLDVSKLLNQEDMTKIDQKTKDAVKA